jgi:hypothetical protein
VIPPSPGSTTAPARARGKAVLALEDRLDLGRHARGQAERHEHPRLDVAVLVSAVQADRGAVEQLDAVPVPILVDQVRVPLLSDVEERTELFLRDRDESVGHPGAAHPLARRLVDAAIRVEEHDVEKNAWICEAIRLLALRLGEWEANPDVLAPLDMGDLPAL